MVDVECGSGQSITTFSPYFDKILAIDPSAQIKPAKKNNSLYENIRFIEQVAENKPIYQVKK